MRLSNYVKSFAAEQLPPTAFPIPQWVPALLIQGTFIMSGAKKSVSMPWEGDFC